MMTQNGYISETPVEEYKETIDITSLHCLYSRIIIENSSDELRPKATAYIERK